MIDFIKIVICLIYLLNKTNGFNKDIVIFNGPSDHDQTSYTFISTENRIKRNLDWIYPEIDKDQISCGHNVYLKLYTCSSQKDCKAISTCLESVHCPLTLKSFGGLIFNVLRLLGINNCNPTDQIDLCPHEKRLKILNNLFPHWANSNDDSYCNNISTLMDEIKKEIQSECPLNLRQVEAFLENYRCPAINNTTLDSIVTTTNRNEFENGIHIPNIEAIITPPPTILSTEIGYIDEENDLKFFDSNQNLLNNSEQTVYVNDHQYYNVSYFVPKTEGIPLHFVQDYKQFNRIHELSNQHRSAFKIKLSFRFPFYGHLINTVWVATGGFMYTGDIVHPALIRNTQYIAPFMANFDASIGNNESEIKYYDNSTHFICTWNKIYLQDQTDAGPFTFQAILQNTGNIYFNYLNIPNVKVSNLYHAHRIGVSDAFLTEHSANEHMIRIITRYNKINLDEKNIKSGVSVVFDMDQTCNTFTDCASCLANRGKRYNCSWCDDIQKCSDGFDRSHQQWVRARCHHIASEDTCPNNIDETYATNQFPPLFSSPSSISSFEKRKQSYSSSPRHFSTFRTIVLTLLLTVLILSLILFAGTYIYAYRNPTSPAGMWLLEHRPSNYIARFKRFTGSN